MGLINATIIFYTHRFVSCNWFAWYTHPQPSCFKRIYQANHPCPYYNYKLMYVHMYLCMYVYVYVFWKIIHSIQGLAHLPNPTTISTLCVVINIIAALRNQSVGEWTTLMNNEVGSYRVIKGWINHNNHRHVFSTQYFVAMSNWELLLCICPNTKALITISHAL